jgi:hypothetical protein
MEHEPSEFEQGKLQGKTEATLIGIADSIDNLQMTLHESIATCHKRIDIWDQRMWTMAAGIILSLMGVLFAIIEIKMKR